MPRSLATAASLSATSLDTAIWERLVTHSLVYKLISVVNNMKQLIYITHYIYNKISNF
ncbi:hypothetical protein TUZN_1083 [Thermoproteus uzoniensis 768-20]|uniref:Uncharacterized protein n=1 Tax=Thermoproteus uzoniensis (strain 768-20) TaxID=999630 RepID=F2L081_THEU7|nr:hypothetical protein TUZN_1083 [Thermoproteus uzoniensis 768-20]